MAEGGCRDGEGEGEGEGETSSHGPDSRRRLN